jgi:hypothetical protein
LKNTFQTYINSSASKNPYTRSILGIIFGSSLHGDLGHVSPYSGMHVSSFSNTE